MSVSLSQNSRLRFSQFVNTDGVSFWDLPEFPTIVKQSDDLQYRVVATDRIDTLASKFYGDPVLWWVIAVANDMELLPTDISEGQLIRIPSPRYVSQTLFQKAGGR